MDVEVLPQLAAPFTIARSGPVVVEQGSEANIASNVYNVAVCPIGFRQDLPEFGVPSLVDGHYPVDLATLEGAIHRWEPEADLELEQQRTAIGQAGISIAI